MDNSKSIKCRKCGGPHLTIKCGKEPEVLVPNQTIKLETNNEKLDNDKKSYKKDYNKLDSNYEKKDNNKLDSDYEKKDNKVYKVKITNLPPDFEYYEISEFAKDWGHIMKINVKNYDHWTLAVIEFKYNEEAEYFIEALDNTSFGYEIIKVVKLEE